MRGGCCLPQAEAGLGVLQAVEGVVPAGEEGFQLCEDADGVGLGDRCGCVVWCCRANVTENVVAALASAVALGGEEIAGLEGLQQLQA